MAVKSNKRQFRIVDRQKGKLNITKNNLHEVVGNTAENSAIISTWKQLTDTPSIIEPLRTVRGDSTGNYLEFWDAEAAFSKNTAFNKDFGTVPGTVMEGWDKDYNDLINVPTPLLQTINNPLDSYFGARLTPTSANEGFYVNTSNNKAAGVLVNNTSAGNVALSGFRATVGSDPFGNGAFLGIAGAGYYAPWLRNHALITGKDINILTGDNTGSIIFSLGNTATNQITEAQQDKVLRLNSDRTIVAPSLTTALIDGEATGKVLLTREWFENNLYTAGNGLTLNTQEFELGGVLNRITQINTTDKLFYINGGGTNKGYFHIQNTKAEVDVFGAAEFGIADSFDFLTSGFRAFSDKFQFETNYGKGIEYKADYSGTYTNRSLVDKEYVDTLYDLQRVLENGYYSESPDTDTYLYLGTHIDDGFLQARFGDGLYSTEIYADSQAFYSLVDDEFGFRYFALNSTEIELRIGNKFLGNRDSVFQLSQPNSLFSSQFILGEPSTISANTTYYIPLSVNGVYADSDGEINLGFSSSNVSNWDTAFSWGDHAGLYVGLTGNDSIVGIKTFNGNTVFNSTVALPAAFYSEDFSVSLGDFTTSGDQPWIRVTDEGNGDLFSARSGTITHNEISILTLNKTTTQEFTLCSFDYKTSTEENFDWLFVVLDGQLIDRFSGDIDWTTRQFYIQGIGDHEIKFIYFRDHADDGGTNQVWVDNVALYNYTIDAYSLGSFDIADDLYVSGNSIVKNKLTVGGEIITNGEFHLFNPVTEIRAARIRSRASSNAFTLYGQEGNSAMAMYSVTANNVLEIFSNITPETLKAQFGNFNDVASLEMRGATAKARIGENLGSDPDKMLVVNGEGLFRNYVTVADSAGFKTASGLSTQFLKADGSLDSNTYATTSLIGSQVEEEIEFVGGETNWVLSGTPSGLFPHRLYAGSSSGGGLILLDEGVDYTLSGNTITYLAPVLPIDPDEKHIIHYNVPSAPSSWTNPNGDVKLRNADVYEPVNTSAYYKNGVIYDSRNLQLMVVTDLHGDTVAVQNAITMMNEFDTIDGGLNLGDTCINTWLDDFTFVNPLMTIGKPFLIAIGNHDEGLGYTIADTGSTSAAYTRFVQPYEASIGGTHAGKSYYYKDWTDYKIRTIMLYEYDDNDDVDPGDPLLYRVAKTARVWSQAQIDWLISTLNSTPSDYSVMITMHQTVVDQLTWTENKFTDINHIVPGDSYSFSDEALIPDIVNAWINGTTVSGNYPFTGDAAYKSDIVINADFTVRGAGNFICYMAGHAHVDANGTVPGYPDQLQIILTCATSDAFRNRYGDIQRQVGQRSEDCINVVSFDTFNRKVKIVRIGAQITFDMRKRDYIEIPY